MSATSTPHLNFRGQAREAIEFYASVFGGEPTIMTFGMAHYELDGALPDQVLWAGLSAPSGLRVMTFDVPPERPHDRGVDSVFVVVEGDEDEITAFYTGLADGANVRTDLGPAPWSPLYGMLDDRFGITWVLQKAQG